MGWIRHKSRRGPLVLVHRRTGSREAVSQVGDATVPTAKDVRETTPLERWLGAESLMSLCVQVFADLHETHHLSRLLIVSCNAGGPSGWVLMPHEENSPLVEDWFAQFDCHPAGRPGEVIGTSFERTSQRFDVDPGLRRAGFTHGASVGTGRAVSYHVYWGWDGLADSAGGHAAGDRVPTDNVFDGPLWSPLQVALINMSRMEYLRELSHIDSLTHAFNRRHFNLRLTEEISRARRFNRPLSLVVFDIDRFKELNDAYGHQVGDALLQRLADHVRLTVRSIDLLCRIGGDEFAVLMPDTDINDCTRFGGRLRTSLSAQRFAVDARQLPTPLLISIGGAAFPCHAQNAEALLWCADMALLEAKQQGRDRFVFYTDGLGSTAACPRSGRSPNGP